MTNVRTPQDHHRLKVRATGRAQTRLARLYPALYRRLFVEELENVYAEEDGE